MHTARRLEAVIRVIAIRNVRTHLEYDWFMEVSVLIKVVELGPIKSADTDCNDLLFRLEVFKNQSCGYYYGKLWRLDRARLSCEFKGKIVKSDCSLFVLEKFVVDSEIQETKCEDVIAKYIQSIVDKLQCAS